MRKKIQWFLLVICFGLFKISSVSAQSIDNTNLRLTESVDTTWVNHYMSGLLPGEIQMLASTTDEIGNIFVTGMIKNILSGPDYITIKYSTDGAEQWRAIYDGPGSSYDKATSIAVDAQGNVYVTGGSDGIDYNRDYATIKYNSVGQEVWVVRYDGQPGGEYNYDGANALALDIDGNVYVTGGSDSYTDGDYATIKYNNDGIEQWVARYDGPDDQGEDTAYQMALDSSGNIYVTGRSYGRNTRQDYATVKYNSDGVEQWVARYNGPGDHNDQTSAIATDDSGNVFVTGSSVNANFKWDYATVKYNSAGTEQWAVRFTGPANSNDNAKDLVLNDSGFVYVTGNSYDATTKDDFTTIKYNSSGGEEWVARYNGSINGSDKATAIEIDDSGNIFVAGQSEGSAVVKYTPAGQEVWSTNYLNIFSVTTLSLDGSGNSYIAGNNYYDCATIKFNNSGVKEWSVDLSGPGTSYEQPIAMELDQYGNLYVAGNSTASGTEDDYIIIKYNADGIEEEVIRYNGPDSISEIASDFALDGAGNMYITGISSYGSDYDWLTVKFNSNGEKQWIASFDGPGNYYDQANALVVDKSGNVYVTGNSAGTSSFDGIDYTTIKYNESGEEQWIAKYDGPGSMKDDAMDIVLDDSGNVYITGTSPGTTTGYDFATIKYNNDGVEKWVKRYNGFGNSPDIGKLIAVDNLGNIVVCGESVGDGTNGDYATIQYTSLGDTNWVRRYNGTGNFRDSPAALDIDEEGAVFVSGYARGSSSDDDYLTIKYDQQGNEEWSSKYNGTGYSYDQATAQALGENGSVYVTGISTGFNKSYDYTTIKINSNGTREWAMRYDFKYDDPVDVVTDGKGHIYVTGTSLFDYDTENRCTTIKYTDPSATKIEYTRSNNPGSFELQQNYPNPFNPSTTIRFGLPEAEFVNISIYNMLGQKVTTIVNKEMKAGYHEINFQVNDLASGMYIYHLRAGKNIESKRMSILK